ncbi:MAG: PKD domain-containing protein [Bacteroidota bacterium]
MIKQQGIRSLLLALFLLGVCPLFAQHGGGTLTNNFANTWLFGGVGLDFNCSPPNVIREGKITTWVEGPSTISDECGNLQFYCNGDSIWNSLHNSVNGGGVFPMVGSKQATQSSLILPNLQAPGTFYFFTVDGDEVNNFNGLSYTEFSFNAPGGPGYVVSNRVLARYTNEMVTACSDGQGGYWVVTKLKGNADFRAYHVTNLGVDTNAVVSSVGSTKTETGQMKFSPDGRYLAISRPLQLFKFNPTTGVVSSYLGDMENGWLDDGNTVEFSPSGRFLYTNNYNGGTAPAEEGIYQYDLSLDPAVIAKLPLKVTSPTAKPKGGMQLGPDGKIYVIDGEGVDKLSVIQRPEKLGSDCDYQHQIINLNLSKPGKYFPNFNQSWFVDPDLYIADKRCHADTTVLEMNPERWSILTDGKKIDSFKWTIFDPNGGTQSGTGNTIKHYFPQFGCFRVEMIAYSSALGMSVVREDLVKINITPTTNMGPKDTALCKQPRRIFLNIATADNPGSSYVWYYKSFPDVISGKPDLGINPLGVAPNITAETEGRYWVIKTFKCCSMTDTIDVYHDSIIPMFRLNDGLQCERDNQYVFTNLSTPAYKSTTWDYGDGTKGFTNIGVKHYKTAGTYTPVMTVVSEKGCKATMSRVILVVKHPVAKFIVDTLQQCFEGNVFKVKDTSYIEFGQGGIVSRLFNKGLSSTDTTRKLQFNISYPKAGTYTISLALNSSQDCKDTMYQQVRVFAKPKAGFTINDDNQCLSANKFEYTDTSFVSLDTINYRGWMFADTLPPEDRTTLPLNNFRSYSKVDSFKVQLKVGTGPGCYDSIIKYVHVHGDPYVDFKANDSDQCLFGNTYDFKDTTYTEKGFVQTYLWNFGDNTAIANSGFGKKYSNYGTYKVQLRVITNKGCTDSVSREVVVFPMPEADFAIAQPEMCFKTHGFTFSAAPSFVPTGSVFSYDWDFGDGTKSTLKEPPVKNYSQDTTHKIKLIVVSDKSCGDTVTKQVSFYPTPTAKAKVNRPLQCLDGNVFNFRGDSSIAGAGVISQYLWEFGDGTIGTDDFPEAKIYAYPDTFNVRLNITTDKGCTDTTSVNVVVLPSPTVNFSVEPTCLFEPSKFKNKSSAHPGKIVNYNWSLGDGTSSGDSTPNHTYANTGAYTVSLSVESSFGCKATITKVNEAIVKALPQALFGHEKVDFDEKNTTIQFIDSSYDVDQWFWDFGNGMMSNQSDPLIVFSDTATLPIRLVVTNTEGCYDTIRKTLFVAPDFFFHVPNAFTPNDDGNNPLFGGEGTRYYKEYSLRIFNRWGQLVFEADSPLKRWDGKYKGEPCEDGAYTYIYALRDVFGFYHNFSGTVHLLR